MLRWLRFLGRREAFNIGYAEGWQAGYEAAEEKEDEAICGFETTYNWRNHAPERGRREKANQATH